MIVEQTIHTIQIRSTNTATINIENILNVLNRNFNSNHFFIYKM